MELDEVDRGILSLLQRDARDISTREIAEHVDVSASTVRNRIAKLEEAGVIRGYYPDIDYSRVNFQLHVLFVCRVPPDARDRLGDEASDVPGVVTIHEVIDGEENVLVEAVGRDTEDIGRISDTLSGLGIAVVESKLIKRTRTLPFDHFGQAVEE